MNRAGVAVLAILCLAIGIGAPLPYFVSSWETMADADQGLAAHYLDQPPSIRAALLVHAGSSGLALVLMPLQWSGRVRRRWTPLHRWSGRIAACAITLGAASGLVVAQVSYAGAAGRIGFSMLAMTWLYATFRAIDGARHGNHDAHRRWAVRVVSLTLAGITLRMWTGLWIGISRPDSDLASRAAFDEVYVYMPFLSWVPNLAVAEWWLRRRSRPT